ncbi:MAG: hypothetical protein IMZ58_02345 [Thermoplasmata archaeon]|nr:hypothetical protein [Thermoplasmata archaeon]
MPALRKFQGDTTIKYKKPILTIIIIFFLLSSIPNQIISAGATDLNDIKNAEVASGSTNSSGGSIRSLRYWLGHFLAKRIIIINQFFAMAVKAKPEVIEIGNGENVTVDVGLMNIENGEFETQGLPFYMNARFLNFEVLEYPGGNLDGSWLVNFNPPSVQAKAGRDIPLKSQVTISFIAPKDPKNAIQSGILKIRIKDIQAYGNLWWPQSKNISFLNKAMWFLGAAFTMRYGQYSGTVDNTMERIIEILVKVKPYHNVRFEVLPLIQFNPGQIASIPISIQNLGNYNDTYSFRIVGDYSRSTISDPVSISLKPGEKKDTFLGVAVSPNVLDTGTIHTIKVEAYSIDQPNVTIAQRTVFLETKGIYISELGGTGVLLFGIIAIVFVAFFFYRRRKILIKSRKKPEKPWDVSEKQQYLEKLKKEDRARYNAALNEMENEYISSLQSYKSYRKTFLKEARKKSMKRFKDIFKKSDQKKKVKTKILEKKKQQISDISKAEEIKNKGLKLESPIKVDQIKSVIDKSAEMEKQRREQAIIKIKKAQEKQRRKFGKFNY